MLLLSLWKRGSFFASTPTFFIFLLFFFLFFLDIDTLQEGSDSVSVVVASVVEVVSAVSSSLISLSVRSPAPGLAPLVLGAEGFVPAVLGTDGVLSSVGVALGAALEGLFLVRGVRSPTGIMGDVAS